LENPAAGMARRSQSELTAVRLGRQSTLAAGNAERQARKPRPRRLRADTVAPCASATWRHEVSIAHPIRGRAARQSLVRSKRSRTQRGRSPPECRAVVRTLRRAANEIHLHRAPGRCPLHTALSQDCRSPAEPVRVAAHHCRLEPLHELHAGSAPLPLCHSSLRSSSKRSCCCACPVGAPRARSTTSCHERESARPLQHHVMHPLALVAAMRSPGRALDFCSQLAIWRAQLMRCIRPRGWRGDSGALERLERGVKLRARGAQLVISAPRRSAAIGFRHSPPPCAP